MRAQRDRWWCYLRRSARDASSDYHQASPRLRRSSQECIYFEAEHSHLSRSITFTLKTDVEDAKIGCWSIIVWSGSTVIDEMSLPLVSPLPAKSIGWMWGWEERKVTVGRQSTSSMAHCECIQPNRAKYVKNKSCIDCPSPACLVPEQDGQINSDLSPHSIISSRACRIS